MNAVVENITAQATKSSVNPFKLEISHFRFKRKNMNNADKVDKYMTKNTLPTGLNNDSRSMIAKEKSQYWYEGFLLQTVKKPSKPIHK